jgi:hypothetical protein
MPIYRLLDHRSFSPAEIEMLGSVFEDALRELRSTHRNDPAARALAKRISSLARQAAWYRPSTIDFAHEAEYGAPFLLVNPSCASSAAISTQGLGWLFGERTTNAHSKGRAGSNAERPLRRTAGVCLRFRSSAYQRQSGRDRSARQRCCGLTAREHSTRPSASIRH